MNMSLFCQKCNTTSNAYWDQYTINYDLLCMGGHVVGVVVGYMEDRNGEKLPIIKI
jgi:F0F1-type ATP synthase assembly protein I